MKATRLLMEEHQYILRALDVIDEMAGRIADGEQLVDSDLETILQFLQFFGDAHHQEKEESILFPALLKASHADEYQCLCQITFEHNQQRSLLEGIEDALKAHKGRDFLYYAKRLGELVRAHIKCEEEEMFKRADAILTPEEDERVARELEDYGKPLQPGMLSTMLERLTAMEARYATHTDSACEKSHYV